MTPTVALTIAGSDSGGGAGIQADLRTFAALGTFGCTAVAALTAQNTTEVRGVLATPPDFLRLQIEAVLDDLPVAAVKTGMLATAANVGVVADLAAAGRLPNLVVDPVMVSSSGSRLLDADAETAYRDRLFPHAAVITPNCREAGVLLGRDVRTLDDQRRAALALVTMGPGLVVVKGGDAGGEQSEDVVAWADPVDGDRLRGTVRAWMAESAEWAEMARLAEPGERRRVIDVELGDDVMVMRADRVATANNHGTGCSYASATAAGLARSEPPERAVMLAKGFVTDAISGAVGWRLGAGHGPIDHLGWSTRSPAGRSRPAPADPAPMSEPVATRPTPIPTSTPPHRSTT